MKLSKRIIFTLLLLLCCLIIHLYSQNALRVENGYSSHFSPVFTAWLRRLFGWCPISFGDFLYGFLCLWLIIKSIIFFKKMLRKGSVPSKRDYFIGSMIKTIALFCSIYFIFNILWGINYDRKGIAWQLGLDMEPYSKNDLREMNRMLVNKVNASKRSLISGNVQYPSNEDLFNMASNAFTNVSKQYSYLSYQPVSIKSSMWGWLGNYTGFTGYYNPFSGEAQVNTTVPKFLHPFIACHEIAHQLGYAKEMEANFVGFLAARNARDTLLQYSVYLDLFVYANRNLFNVDSVDASQVRKGLDTAVILDLKEWSHFNRKHQNPIEPVFRWIYGKYLESNSQPQGLLSYDEVTAFIISYYKKFGRI